MYHSFLKTTIFSFGLLASTMLIAKNPDQLGREAADGLMKYVVVRARNGNWQSPLHQSKDLIKKVYQLKPQDQTTFLRGATSFLRSLNELHISSSCTLQQRQMISVAKYFAIEMLEKTVQTGRHLTWRLSSPMKLPFTRHEVIEALASAMKKSPECVEARMLSPHAVYVIAEEAINSSDITMYLN